MLDVEGLVDRPFLWGVNDCYGLTRELYERNFGIKLTDFARPTNWSSNDQNLIDNLYAREGFEKITNWKLADLRPGDVLALAIMEANPNHLLIYIGDNQFVHHLYGRFSSLEPMAAHWIHAACFMLRHPDVPDLRPKGTEITIEELLRARYQD